MSYIAGTPYVGANVVYSPGLAGTEGELTAWDPAGRQGRVDHQGEVSRLERDRRDRR